MAWTGAAAASAAATYVSNGTPTVAVTNAQGANLSCRLEKLLVENVDTVTAQTLTIYKVPSGGAISGDDWTVYKAISIPPSDGNGGTEDIREVAGAILANGDSLQLKAGAASKLRFDLSFWKES